MANANGTRVPSGEIGVTGLTSYGGQISQEPFRDLKGARGREQYRDMSLNSAIVGAILFAITQSARQVRWLVDPAQADDPEAERLATFVRGALFDDMSNTWEDTLSEILSMLVYGWCVLEICYKQRLTPEADDPSQRSQFTDGAIGWRKWAIRSQHTLDRWVFDDAGGLQAMIQQDPVMGTRYRMPIDKLLLFRTVSHLNDPEGMSILRTAYRSHYFMKKIETIEAIGIERDLAGYPVFKVLEDGPDIWNAHDPTMVTLKARMERIVKSIRRDEQEGLILPAWLEFSLVSTGGRRSIDPGAAIQRYTQQIAMTVLADFILLGHERSGSWALSSDKTELFSVALAGYLDSIAAVLNRFAIPRLLRLNGEPLALAPKVRHGDIETRDLGVLGPYLDVLVRNGLLTPDDQLQRWLRESADLPAGVDEGVSKRQDAAEGRMSHAVDR